MRISDLVDRNTHRLPEQHSWVLFLGHGWEHENPGRWNLPDLSDIPMIKKTSGENESGGHQPSDNDWYWPSVVRPHPDDTRGQPPSSPPDHPSNDQPPVDHPTVSEVTQGPRYCCQRQSGKKKKNPTDFEQCVLQSLCL